MTVLAKYAAYTADGERCGGGSLQMPEYLDWMDIDVKANWFRHIGQGPSETFYVVLVSQGQEKLIPGISLTQIPYRVFKEREATALDITNKFIAEGGYSREPRNQ